MAATSAKIRTGFAPDAIRWSDEESLPHATKALSARALTIKYIIALLIVAGLSIASHITLALVLHANHGSAAIINISGRQRMLSQRIVSLATEYQMGDPSARPELLAAISEFENAENMLSNDSRNRQDSPAALRLRALYFGAPNPLQSQVRDFVADARAIAAMPPATAANDPPLRRIIAQARSPLLDALNQVVLIHQQEVEQVFAKLEWLQWSILAIVLLTLGFEAIAIFRRMVLQIVKYTSQLIRLATTDSLTELANRRGFLEACRVERSRSARYGRDISLMMLDADHFKSINDKYGHEGGDEVLRRLATELRAALRITDVVARVGGEEFAILLPETDLSGARILAERLREKMAASIVEFREQRIRFTVSVGVTSLHDTNADIREVLNFVDGLMYQAKQNGRNCVVEAHPPPGTFHRENLIAPSF